MKIFLQFKPKAELSPEDKKKGLRMYTLDGICSTGMTSLQSGVFLIAFALALGASRKEIGLIASIAFMSQVMQLLGLLLVNKYPYRKVITVICVGISRLIWIPIILIPFFSNNTAVLINLLLFATIMAAIPAPAWNSLLRDLLPQQQLGKINSRRAMLSLSLGMILTILSGYFIDWWAGIEPSLSLGGYSILFFTGLVFGIIGISAIFRIPEPKSTAGKVKIKELLLTPLKDHNFKMLIIFNAIWNFAVNMSGPFFMVYMMDRLGLTVFHVTIFIVINQLANISFLRIWGKMADRFSNKSVLTLGCPLFLVSIILWTFTTLPEPHGFTIPLVGIIQVLNGIAVAGISLGTTNITMKLSPLGKAHGYMAVLGLTTSILGTIAPVTGGFLADWFETIQLTIPLQLTTTNAEYLLSIIHLKGLDFLFLLSFLIGIYGLHRLAVIAEEGENVEGEVVIDEITDSIIMPLKSISIVAGISRVAIMPLSGIMHVAHRLSNVNKKKRK